MAKRLHAMLDLEPGSEIEDSNDLHNLIDRIQSAAGPVASVMIPPKFVAEAADALYRTRTLVSTSLRATQITDIGEIVSAGVGELELSDFSEIDVEAVISLSHRRTVKLTVSDDHFSLDLIKRWKELGVRFIALDRKHPQILEILNEIRDHSIDIGLKFRECQTFQHCCDIYQLVASNFSESWIWPGTLRFSVQETLQHRIVSHLRSSELQRPTGCGTRPEAANRLFET